MLGGVSTCTAGQTICFNVSRQQMLTGSGCIDLVSVPRFVKVVLFF